MDPKEKKSKRIVICLSNEDFEALQKLALKERISISGLVRHFIIRKIGDPLDNVKVGRG